MVFWTATLSILGFVKFKFLWFGDSFDSGNVLVICEALDDHLVNLKPLLAKILYTPVDVDIASSEQPNKSK